MKISKKILGCIIVMSTFLFTSILAFAAVETKAAALLSYGEWKNRTRGDIQKKVHRIEQKLSDQKDVSAVKSRSKTMARAEKKQSVENLKTELRFEKIKLEASEDLSFHEYFLSYLAEQKDFDQKVIELSKILKPEEIRDLITSYSNIVQKKKRDGQHGYNTSPIDD